MAISDEYFLQFSWTVIQASLGVSSVPGKWLCDYYVLEGDFSAILRTQMSFCLFGSLTNPSKNHITNGVCEMVRELSRRISITQRISHIMSSSFAFYSSQITFSHCLNEFPDLFKRFCFDWFLINEFVPAK